jgi:hypothetical protein
LGTRGAIVRFYLTTGTPRLMVTMPPTRLNNEERTF